MGICVCVCVCRSAAVRLEVEVGELRRNLQQALDHKLEAESEKQEAQNKVNLCTPDPSGRGRANATAVFRFSQIRTAKNSQKI